MRECVSVQGYNKRKGEKREIIFMKIIITTISKKKDAEMLALALLKEKLAACVNIVPIKSIYLWKGRIEKSKEIMMLIKTNNALAEKALQRINELHPYELPVIEVIDAKTNKEAENWISEVTS